MKKYTLKYNSPATYSGKGWQNEVLPVGSGMLGMCIFGIPGTEHLQFNEKTLWTGGPSENRPDYNGGNIKGSSQYLKKIQEALLNGDKKAVLKYKDKLVGIEDGYGAYQNFGEILLDFGHSNFSDYSRSLDITSSVCTVSYTSGNVKYVREHFASVAPKVLATKFTADREKALNFKIKINPAHSVKVNSADNDILTVDGVLDDNALEFSAVLKIRSDGKITAENDCLTVSDATFCEMALSAGTNYKNEYPVYRGESPKSAVNKAVSDFFKIGYDAVKQNAITHYQSLFGRFDLSLSDKIPNVTTDALLSEYKQNPNSENGRYFEELLCQYGRYLIISSSNENDILPANLQGVWNNSNSPAWSCDYHLNVNLQMCYWHSYISNLHETAKPMIAYMDSLREPGRVTAECYHDIKSDADNHENGWVCHTQNTPFGWTCPGWSFYWGWSPAASSWMMQNCFEYYEYTGDKEYLKANIYPVMKENTVFWLNNLLYNESQKRYVSSPSFSPEHGPISIGNTYEQTLIWQLFTDTLKAAKLLGDDEFAKQVDEIRQKLNPVFVGRWGQIKEWYEEDDWYKSLKFRKFGYKKHNCQMRHRHASHLLGLYPGNAITAETPKLLEACKVSLLDRGFGQHGGMNSSGWGKANKVNLWARAKDGERAYSMIQNLLQKNIAPNLWDFHPPYQMDGNCGYTSGVCEMLCYSGEKYIELLPALPKKWNTGSVKGICAKGGFVLDFSWKDGKTYDVVVHSVDDAKKSVDIKVNGEIKTFETV